MGGHRILIAAIVSVLGAVVNAKNVYLDSSVTNWQSVVDYAPKNATFIIKSGVHRKQ